MLLSLCNVTQILLLFTFFHRQSSTKALFAALTLTCYPFVDFFAIFP